MRFFESMVVVAVTGGALLAACGNSEDSGGGGDAGIDGSLAACSTSTDTTSDVHHCGDCTTDCTTLPHVDASKVTCEKSQCVTYPACASGFADCSVTAPGCETTLGTSASCAKCGDSCSSDTPVCNAGACSASCARPFPDACGGSCVDTQTDVNNCGACGTVCASDAGAERGVCVAGVCQSGCQGGFHACGGTCVSNADPAACGPSCSVCPGKPLYAPACFDNACGLTCAPGAHTCGDGTCVDDHAVATCGSSCSACPANGNSSATCDGTSCGYTCLAGSADCNGSAGDQCEVRLDNDAHNCGACGHVCAEGTCSGGMCQPLLALGEPQPMNVAATAAGWYVASANEVAWTANDRSGRLGTGDYADMVAFDFTSFWSSAAGALAYGGVGFANVTAIPVPAGRAPTSLAISAPQPSAPTYVWTDSSGDLLGFKPGAAQPQIVAVTGAAAGTCAYSRAGEAPVWFQTAEGSLWRWDGVSVNAVTLLARALAGSAALTVDATYAYIGGANGTVARVAKAGGALQPLTTRPSPIASLASDGTYLYILTDAALERYELGTGAVSSLASVGAAGSRCHALALTATGYLFASVVQGVSGVYALSR